MNRNIVVQPRGLQFVLGWVTEPQPYVRVLMRTFELMSEGGATLVPCPKPLLATRLDRWRLLQRWRCSTRW